MSLGSFPTKTSAVPPFLAASLFNNKMALSVVCAKAGIADVNTSVARKSAVSLIVPPG
jgi:hypothetical protein